MKRGQKRIITVNGEKLEGEYLGAGLFCRGAYKVGDKVFLFVNDEDFSKEIYTHIDNPHIPKCELVDNTQDDVNVWAMPYYERLSAKANPEAWKQFKALSRIVDECHRDLWIKSRGFQDNLWYELPGMILDKMGDEFPVEMKEAFEELASWIPSYGNNYAIELPKVNVSVDSEGRLILRDIVFNVTLAKEIREQQAEKHMELRRQGL
jgi:hypothetical protein